jgi:catecholate siderophore receptor
MERFKRRPLAAAMLLAFSASAPEWVQAQTQSEQTLPEVRVRGDSYRTETTVSPTRTETPMRDIPQFINTVPQSVIHAQGATTLQDALRNVPGISYAAAEGGTQSNMVLYLRGFPVNQDLYLDGVRDLGEYNRDLFATESVEVLKGPSSLMFGRGSTGGLINQTSKVADLLPRKDVEVTVGSFDKKRLTGDVNVRTGELSAFRLVALVEDSGYYRYPQGDEKVGIAPSLRWGIGGATEVMLSYYYLKTSNVTDYGQPTIYRSPTGAQAPIGFQGFAPIDARKYYGYAKHDFADYETNIGTFRIDHRFSDAVSIRNTLRIANYKRQSESTIPSIAATDANGAAVTAATPAELLLVTRNHDTGRTRDNSDDSIINQTDVIWKFDGLGMKHQMLTGLELSREKLNRWNYTLDADPATAGTQAPTSTTPLLNPDPNTTLSYTKVPNLRGESSGDVIALVVQDQMEISKQWKALLGARLEQFSADAKTTSIVTGAPAAGPFGRTDTMFSGRVGLIWQPSDPQSYYVSFANSFNPSGEMGVYSGTAQTNLSLVNETLDPEENRNYEIGAQWDLGRGIQVRGALFRTTKINQRINDSVTNTTILGGERRVDGMELQVSGQITSNWDLYASGALMDGKIVSASNGTAGNKPLGVPDSVANVWTIYRLGGGFEVGGGLNYNSGSWLTDVNSGPNSAKIPSYVVFDATAAYVQRKYEIRLNVYNLTDELYYVGGYQNSPSRVLPGVPLSAALTMRYSFN